MNIYDFFDSADIAEHCRKLDYKFTATETAYIIWSSHTHTIKQKHSAWQEIIDTMADESLPSNWDFDDHSLHNFLREYMRLQKELVADFCTSKADCFYTYEVFNKNLGEWVKSEQFFGEYNTCISAIQAKVDDDSYNEILKVKVRRRTVLHNPNEETISAEIYFTKTLEPYDIDFDVNDDDERKILNCPYGFYNMWVKIPTPFKQGDIVTVATDTKKKPFVLRSIPYWTECECGVDYTNYVNRLVTNGGDWTDMQTTIWQQDDYGEIVCDHGHEYLNLEYYHEELEGKEKFLLALNNYLQGRIYMDDLLRSHSVVLLEDRAAYMRDCGKIDEIMQLAGLKDRDKNDN
ncbi:MAG: hypothetical protein IJ002_08470 [Clostridia bacterium]|nr:hypothetical protein [Clostridia bacterium]